MRTLSWFQPKSRQFRPKRCLSNPLHAKNIPTTQRVIGMLVEEGGFEPPKSVTTDLQSAPFGRSGTPPYSLGAGGRIRTPDLLITNQLLYRLSYTSKYISNSRVYSSKQFFICQHLFSVFFMFLRREFFAPKPRPPQAAHHTALHSLRAGDPRRRRILGLQRQPGLSGLSAGVCPAGTGPLP